MKIDADGDVHVNYGLQVWVFHPDAVKKVCLFALSCEPRVQLFSAICYCCMCSLYNVWNLYCKLRFETNVYDPCSFFLALLKSGEKGLTSAAMPVQCSISCAIRPTGSWSLCGSMKKPIDDGYRSIFRAWSSCVWSAVWNECIWSSQFFQAFLAATQVALKDRPWGSFTFAVFISSISLLCTF